MGFLDDRSPPRRLPVSGKVRPLESYNVLGVEISRGRNLEAKNALGCRAQTAGTPVGAKIASEGICAAKTAIPGRRFMPSCDVRGED